MKIIVAPDCIGGVATGGKKDGLVVDEKGIIAALRLHFKRVVALSKRVVAARRVRYRGTRHMRVFIDVADTTVIHEQRITTDAVAILAKVEGDSIE